MGTLFSWDYKIRRQDLIEKEGRKPSQETSDKDANAKGSSI